MQKLIRTSIATGILGVIVFLYAIWFDTNETIVKILITLAVLFVVQVVAYLVMRDLHEESSGKDDGTIAR